MDIENTPAYQSNPPQSKITPVLENNGMLFLYNGNERIRLKNNIQRFSMSRDKNGNMHFLALTHQNKLVYICTYENGRVFCEKVILILSGSQSCPYFVSGEGCNDVYITFCIESSTKPMKIFSYKHESGAWRQLSVLTLDTSQYAMISSTTDKDDNMLYCIHDTINNRLILYSLLNNEWCVAGEITGNNDYLHSQNIRVDKTESGYTLSYTNGNTNVRERFITYNKSFNNEFTPDATSDITLPQYHHDFSACIKESHQENSIQINNIKDQINKLTNDINRILNVIDKINTVQGENKAIEDELHRISKEVSKQYKLSVDLRDKIKQHEQHIIKINVHISELENRLSAINATSNKI